MFSKLFFCLIFLAALTPLYSQEPLAQQLKSIIENKKATIGIAVLYNGKILVTVNDKAGYPMMSTFKFPLALAVLERLDKQGLPLETELLSVNRTCIRIPTVRSGKPARKAILR